MNKKVLVIVGLAVALAASAGVYTLASSNANVTDSSEVTEAFADVTDNTTYYEDVEEPLIDEPSDTDAEATELTEDTQEETRYMDDIISTTFTIQRVVDHTTDEEIQPRIAFGSSYRSCYISFDTGGNFELFMDTASGEVRKGTYRLYDSIISVEYSDGVGSEYEIIPDDDGNISYIIVNYGDYNVYFG